MALFAAGASSRTGDSAAKNLVEFRAGKLNLRGTRVVPDKRKGMFYIHRERETMLTHVCWKDRGTGTVEDDLIVFPDDCEWKRVDKCTTGRVYLLRFTSTNKKLFFWMQEPKESKDDDFSKKINKVLNEPEEVGDVGGGGGQEQLLAQMLSGAAGGAGGGSSALQDQLLQQFLTGQLGNLSAARSTTSSRAQTATQRASASETPANLAPAAHTPVRINPPPQQQIQLSEFQNIMQQLTGSAGEDGAGAAVGGGGGRGNHPVDLASGLPLDMGLLTGEAAVRERLEPHVPHDEHGRPGVMPPRDQELPISLQSPQFRQALSSFSMAFASGQLGPVISQFELNEEAQLAAQSGDLEAFVKALNRQAGTEVQPGDEEKADHPNPPDKPSDDKDKDGDVMDTS